MYVSFCMMIVPTNEFRFGFSIGSFIWTIGHFWSHYIHPFNRLDTIVIIGRYLIILILLFTTTYINSRVIASLFVHKTMEKRAYKDMNNLVNTFPDGVLVLKH